MEIEKALDVLNRENLVVEAVKNESRMIEIPVSRNGNNVVFWRVKTKVDLDRDEIVIDWKSIHFGHPDRFISGSYESDENGIPDSAKRTPSSAASYIAKHPEWGSATAEDFKIDLERKIKSLNADRIDDRNRLAKSSVTRNFKSELDALLKKYGATVKGNCWSAYDPARGEVWIEMKDGDNLDLIDLDEDGEYKPE